MKKYRVVVSLLLLCMMLLPIISAKGESCYVALRELLSSEKQEEWYLGRGVSAPEEKDNEGNSAILYAASAGNSELVKWLVEHGADINAKDNSGHTVLKYITQNGSMEMVVWLRDHGAK